MTKRLNFLIICADFYADIADTMVANAKNYLDKEIMAELHK